MGGFNCAATRGGHQSKGITCNVCFSGVMPVGTKCPKANENQKFRSGLARHMADRARRAGAVAFKIEPAGASMISRFERLQFVDSGGKDVGTDSPPMDWSDIRILSDDMRMAGFGKQ